jgi:acetyl/propionyl-CoA carboxylase alpha subunit
VLSNRELLVGILREPEFRAGRIDTGYLERHDPQRLAESGSTPGAVRAHALAAALAGQAERRAGAEVLKTLPSGWRNVVNSPQLAVFDAGGHGVDVRYLFRSGRLEAEVDGTPMAGVVLWAATATRVDLEVDGVRRVIRVNRSGPVSYVDSSLGSTTLVERPRFPEPGSRAAPGSLLAPMPGTVVRVAAEPGMEVTAGTVIIVLEAMKMEHSVSAPHDGTVTEIGVSVGQTVDLGVVLAVVQEPS